MEKTTADVTMPHTSAALVKPGRWGAAFVLASVIVVVGGLWEWGTRSYQFFVVIRKTD
jgi:hypothetical protein